jgi:hypothetical protein
MMPMFVSMQTIRRGVTEAPAEAANAGRIASRNGNAIVTPTPRKKARRDSGELLEVNAKFMGGARALIE